MKSFEEMWSYSNTIVGSFTENEGRAMYDQLSQLPDESIVVEVGSYLGRSASLIGQVAIAKGFEFACVDSFITGYEAQDVETEFKKHMNRNIVRYELLAMASHRASHLFSDDEINFLFIDGDHRKTGVCSDVDNWLPKVRWPGPVLFHDYNSSWTGVKEAVDFYSDKLDFGLTIDSLLITNKHMQS